MADIKMPQVIWSLGDREQETQSGVTVVRRPIFYKGRRVGEIDPDYAERLMKMFRKATK